MLSSSLQVPTPHSSRLQLCYRSHRADRTFFLVWCPRTSDRPFRNICNTEMSFSVAQRLNSRGVVQRYNWPMRRGCVKSCPVTCKEALNDLDKTNFDHVPPTGQKSLQTGHCPSLMTKFDFITSRWKSQASSLRPGSFLLQGSLV